MRGDQTGRLEHAAGYFALAALLFAGTVAFWALFLRVAPFDPIDFEIQTIEEPTLEDPGFTIPRIEGLNGPAVEIGEIVPSHVVVTIDNDEPVEFIGNIVWVTDVPPGVECDEIDNVPRVLGPGVHVFDFKNPMPECVLDAAAELGISQWRITGTATPTAPGGVSAVWTTEPFWIKS